MVKKPPYTPNTLMLELCPEVCGFSLYLQSSIVCKTLGLLYCSGWAHGLQIYDSPWTEVKNYCSNVRENQERWACRCSRIQPTNSDHIRPVPYCSWKQMCKWRLPISGLHYSPRPRVLQGREDVCHLLDPHPSLPTHPGWAYLKSVRTHHPPTQNPVFSQK